MEIAPPPVLSSSRVMAYVIVPDDIPFTGRTSIFIDGVLLGRVPRLAICISLRDDSDALLLYCDVDWNELGVTGQGSVENLKSYAEKNYPGHSDHCVDINTSVEDAHRYYDEAFAPARCTFCGRRMYEVETMLQGETTWECNFCVDAHSSSHR